MADRELSSAPGPATLYPRAVAGATVLPALRRVPGLGARFAGDGATLPDEQLVLCDVAIDRGRLAAYDRVCGFDLRDRLPATYPHLLAFGLAMRLMTDAAFPFPAIGLVHVGNRIEQLRPIAQDERLTLRVRATDLAPHDRGTQFDMLAEAAVGEETVWRGRSTYLHRERGSGSGDADRTGGKHDRGGDDGHEPGAVWHVPGDIGRRYGAVSGDRNPIHLHPLTARLFGMPHPIAHGMWVKARCLAALEASLPETFAVEVRFKLPLPVPATVGFATWPDGDRRCFEVRDRDSAKPHLAGAVERA